MSATNPPDRVGIAVRYPASPPPVIGYADRCALLPRDGVYEVAFLDSIFGRSLARIVVAEAPLVEHLWGSSVEFYRLTRKALAEEGIEPIASLDSLPTEDMTVPLPANVFRMFRIGLEAAFEAYYVPPRLAHEASEKLRQGQKVKQLALNAVCHVALGLPVLVGLLDAIESLVTRIEAGST